MSQKYFTYDFLFKFIVVGDSNVGKTWASLAYEIGANKRDACSLTHMD